MGAPEPLPPFPANSSSDDRPDDNSEWEYEYDEDTTEDFYFTLDVTSNQSRPISDEALAQRFDQKFGEQDDQPATPQTKDTRSKRLQRAAMESSQLQIVDLPSTQPLIKLGGALYACHWSTDLGTQIYVSRPGSAKTPLKAGQTLDVVGLSRARLVGRSVAPKKRKTVGSSVASAIAVDVDSDYGDMTGETPNVRFTQDTPLPDGGQAARFAAVRANTADPALKAQASFLERLTNVKRQKGEADTVPLYGVKQYKVQEAREEAQKLTPKPEKPSKFGPRGPYKKRKTASLDAGTTGADQTRQSTAQTGPMEGASSSIAMAMGTSTQHEMTTEAGYDEANALAADESQANHAATQGQTQGGAEGEPNEDMQIDGDEQDQEQAVPTQEAGEET